MKSNTTSVIIPCYNRAACILRTLRNVLEQTRTPDEVIVVDDGSTDESTKVVKTFGDRVRLIEQENRGPGAARNRGLEASTGEFVWFMDSDDLASLNKLEIQCRDLETTGADLAYGPWVRSRIDGDRIDTVGPVLQSRGLPPDRSMLEWQVGGWCTVFQACIFRRAALERAGRYHTDMRVAEDGEYLVRILAAGARPLFTPGCLLFYRSEGTDQLTQANDSAVRHAADLTRYYERVGEALEQKLAALPRAVLLDLALQVHRHNRFCEEIGKPGIDPENPVMGIVKRIGWPLLQLYDRCVRVRRRVRQLPTDLPDSRGMQWRSAGQDEWTLIQNTSFSLRQGV